MIWEWLAGKDYYCITPKKRLRVSCPPRKPHLKPGIIILTHHQTSLVRTPLLEIESLIRLVWGLKLSQLWKSPIVLT
ncbi:hypothetical protein FIBSPDRAFT_860216 [Athelia psychrophila]|uniref:Uncharacterized protein n=1 Tax=Athelia psychrophila TaxID=1759441 RepID=A0A166KEH9_9AGAM|nr:hypothetical protein FIBSPDRAFT_860216 [Fibularhizoctonia sp. CBS 109695]